MESVESIASGGTVEALTLAAALTAALVSIYNAWRAWKNWSIDRRAKRFEDSLDRALDPDATTARVGVEQLDGLRRRKELHRNDQAYMADTLQALMPPRPAGYAPGVDSVIITRLPQQSASPEGKGGGS
ncbi:hypothetical protein [Luteipulveratus halotolerans]|uniref:hypothetical protein n=1 Tax=Luteipulveratus halotolerans TaxID=1631356 RepID=UPI0018D1822B|nr:hypothetical protein [Luteipulveratus halotolerans]